MDEIGRPHAQRVRMFKALVHRHTWLWTVLDSVRDASIQSALDASSPLYAPAVRALRAAHDATHDLLDQSHQEFLYMRVLQSQGSTVANFLIGEDLLAFQAHLKRLNWSCKHAKQLVGVPARIAAATNCAIAAASIGEGKHLIMS